MCPSLMCVGLPTIERIVRVAAMPVRGSKGRASGYSERVGGVAVEAAIAARAIGVDVRLLAPIGDDAAGREILAHLQSQDVNTATLIAVPRARSACEAIFVDAAGRRATVRYEDDAVQARAVLPDVSLLGETNCVLADLSWKQGAAHVLSAARHRGVATSVVVTADDEAEPLCRLADHVLIDAGIAAAPGIGDNAAVVLQRFCESVGAGACVTAGAGKVLLAANGRSEQAKIPGLEPTDLTGSFASAYALAIAERRSAVEAARMAAVTAVLARTALAGGYKYPSREDVNAILMSLE